MFVRRIAFVLVATAALVLAGCATAPQPRSAGYAAFMGQYDISRIALLDAHNQEVPSEQLLRAAIHKKFAEDGAEFLKKHPGMTKQTFMKMMDVIVTAKVRNDDPVKHMLDRVRDNLTDALDGKPGLTLADASMRSLKKILLPQANGDDKDDVVTASDVTYQLRDVDGVRTLIARGTLEGEPVQLNMYLLKDHGMFLDVLPLIRDQLGKKAREVLSLGVDKFGIFLVRRDVR